MADRYPLVYNPSANQIQELQSGDSIDLGGGNLKNTVFSGIVTATGFSGDGAGLTGITGTSDTLDNVLARGSTSSRSVTFGPVTGTTGTFTGDVTVANLTAANVTIAGTITYDDVTNVDSLGVGTFRTGIKVLAGGANIVGNSTVTGILTATSFVKTGGTSSQFLKADGSSDGTAYISAIGISSAGTSIGNATTLNFIGVGNTFAVNGNTIDVSIQGSSGGSGGGALDITSCLFI